MRRVPSRIPTREIVAVALLVPIIVLFCIHAVMGGSLDSQPAYLDFPAHTEIYGFETKNSSHVPVDVSAFSDLPLLALTVNENDTLDLTYSPYSSHSVRGSLVHAAVWEHGNLYQVLPTEDNDSLNWTATLSAPEGEISHNGSQTWMICFNDYGLKYIRSEWLTLNADGSAIYGHGKFNVFTADARTRKKNEFEGTWRNTTFDGSPATFVEFEKGWLALFSTPRSLQNASQ